MAELRSPSRSHFPRLTNPGANQLAKSHPGTETTHAHTSTRARAQRPRAPQLEDIIDRGSSATNEDHSFAVVAGRPHEVIVVVAVEAAVAQSRPLQDIHWLLSSCCSTSAPGAHFAPQSPEPDCQRLQRCGTAVIKFQIRESENQLRMRQVLNESDGRYDSDGLRARPGSRGPAASSQGGRPQSHVCPVP